MSMTGIEVGEDVSEIYNGMKLRHTHKWVTFKIKDKKTVVLDKQNTGEGDINKDKGQFEELKDALIVDQNFHPRYILFDFNFKAKSERVINKLAFIFWCDDDNAPIGEKMIYASTKDTVKKAFTGLGLEFQANNKDGMDYETFRAEVERKA